MLVKDTGEKIRIIGKNEMISMNPQTGYTYYINFQNNSIRNITYKRGENFYSQIIRNEMGEHKSSTYVYGLKELRKIFVNRNMVLPPCHLVKYYMQGTPKGWASINNINVFSTALRFPYAIDKSQKTVSTYLHELNTNKELRKMRPDNNLFEIFDIYNIKAKNAIVKQLREDVKNIIYFPQMSLFNKPDNQIKVLGCNIGSEGVTFLKQYLKYQDENNVANKIVGLRQGAWFLNDIGRMYIQIKDKNILKEKDFQDIHDLLSIRLRHKKDEDYFKPFKYKDKVLEKEDVIDGIKFWLPKDALSLQTVSREMGNCISGYVNQVRTAQEIIVVMDEYKAALSFRGNRVTQAFGKYNRKMENKYISAFYKWCEKYEMNKDNCMGIGRNMWEDDEDEPVAEIAF
jgi:hypothetical protein